MAKSVLVNCPAPDLYMDAPTEKTKPGYAKVVDGDSPIDLVIGYDLGGGNALIDDLGS